jgi:hypothetical protein
MCAGQCRELLRKDSDLSGRSPACALTGRWFLPLALLLCLMPLCIQASIITNDNTTLVFFGDSYDTSPFHYFGDYLASWVALGHPQFTNHYSSASRGGGSLEEANEDRLERLGLAHWESGQKSIGLIMADDNGGYTSNQVQMNLTNTLLSPTNFFNGFAYTNEGGWCSTQSITWVGIGAIPHDSSDGDSGEVARNDAVTNLFMSLGRPFVDMWNPLWTGGWSNDNNGAQLLGFDSGGHPFASGSLTMGITIAQKLADVDTNVSLAAIDFSTGKIVFTNHCVISSISKNGNGITFTRHDDRLPLAFDVPDGTITNDCRNAFIAMPQLSNAFWFTIAVTNLPVGNYVVNIDGAPVTTLSSSALAAGWNMFTDWSSNSPYWKQRVAVLALVRLKNGTDPVTLIDHSAGMNGPNGPDLVNYYSTSQAFWDDGFRGDALVSQLQSISASLAGIDTLIHNAAQPTNHVFTITPIQTITFPSPGNQAYGVAPITLNATASSGLPVIYSVTSGPAIVSSNVLTITGPGSIAIQASQPGNSAWAAAAPVTETITVAPGTLTASVTANNKTYDGTSTATLAAETLSGLVGNDMVALTVESAAFSDKTVGAGKTVTATGLNLGGPDAGKYVLASTTATTTASITAASLTVSGITAANRVYNGKLTASINMNNAVLLGIFGTDNVTFEGIPIGMFSDSNAGLGKTVTISGLTLNGSDAGNYLLTPPTATANITLASTANTINSSMNPTPPGSNTTFTATVNALPPGGGTPTGNVIFIDGTTLIGTSALDGSATASFSIGSLTRGNHTITAQYSGDRNFFGSTNSFNQLIDSQPVANTVILERSSDSGTKILFSDLVTNAIDPDGDTLALVSISATSASGGTILTNGQWVCYQPPAAFTNADVFSYAVADSLGLQSTGTVAVIVGTDTNGLQNFVHGDFRDDLSVVKFLGIPQRVYTIQYTTNLPAPAWQTLGTAAAAGNGVIVFFDTPPPGSPQRFYRTTYP